MSAHLHIGSHLDSADRAFPFASAFRVVANPVSPGLLCVVFLHDFRVLELVHKKAFLVRFLTPAPHLAQPLLPCTRWCCKASTGPEQLSLRRMMSLGTFQGLTRRPRREQGPPAQLPGAPGAPGAEWRPGQARFREGSGSAPRPGKVLES